MECVAKKWDDFVILQYVEHKMARFDVLARKSFSSKIFPPYGFVHCCNYLRLKRIKGRIIRASKRL